MNEEYYESQAFQSKLGHMPKYMQTSFLKHVEVMYEQETDSMLRFIEESRRALQLTASEIQGEQEALQLTCRKLAESRATPRSAQSYSARSRRQRALPKSPSDPAKLSRRFGESPDPLRHPSYPQPASRLPPLQQTPAASVRYESEASDRGRPGSSPRELDESPDGYMSFEEETEEIMRGMRGASAKMANERERQLQLVAERKLQRRAKNTEKAQELLREASAIDQRRFQDKERQKQKIQERLEEKKRQKEVTGLGGATLDSIELSTSPSPSPLPDVDVDVEISKKARRKSKKDKKKEDDTETKEEKKKRKEEKKRKKKLAADGILDV